MERLYGVREGRPEKLPNISAVTQSDLATQLGMSVDTLQNYKMLADMIPELERLYGIEHGGYRKSKLNNSVLNNSQSDLASPQKNVIIYLLSLIHI